MINAYKISVRNSGSRTFRTPMRRCKDSPETGLEQNAKWFPVPRYRLQCAAFVNNEMNRVVRRARNVFTYSAHISFSLKTLAALDKLKITKEMWFLCGRLHFDMPELTEGRVYSKVIVALR